MTDPVPTADDANEPGEPGGSADAVGPGEPGGSADAVGPGEPGGSADAVGPGEPGGSAIAVGPGVASASARPLLAVLYGLLAAVVAVFGWFLASVGTKSQLVYLAVALGVAVGYFVNVGARRGSALTSALAVVITLIGCTAGFFFVSRSSLIRRGYVQLVGGDTRIPLRPSYRLVRDVLRANLRSNVAPYVYLVVALVAAAYFGLRGLDATKRHAEH